MKVAVIGAGIGGLAVAVRLKRLGLEVDVYEANSYPGGKLCEIRRGDYRFDAGPSLFTLPYLVDELFTINNKDPKQYFEYEQLKLACRYFYEDGKIINAYTDRKKFAEEIELKTGVDRSRIIEYLDRQQEMFESTGKLFLGKSLHKLKSYLNQGSLQALKALSWQSLFSTMQATNQAAFEEPHLVQLFNRFATYNGSNPYQTPGMLSMIAHLEHNIGAFMPRGGMVSITNSVYQLGQDLGVNYHLNTPVDEIVVDWKKRANGVKIGNEILKYNLVVSNMDVNPTYRRLLPGQKAPEKTLAQERSSSALIYYWGIKHEFEQLDTHNIFFSQNYQEEFNHIFKHKSISQDPTVYINITSNHNTADAPPGAQNWFVMVNVPANYGQDWNQLISETRKNVILKLNRMLKTDLNKLIEVEDILHPKLLQARTQSHLGALYGTSSNTRMAAFLRHPNFSNKIQGLYFTGGSVHPGGGIPLCLLSAKITAELIEKDYEVVDYK